MKTSFSVCACVSLLSVALFACDGDSDNEDEATALEWVDLGLSVKWAACNVGATKLYENGGLYGWCDPTGLNVSTEMADYPDGYKTEYDIARAKWGSPWRLATHDEQRELLDRCVWEWTLLDGYEIMKVTGPNGNSIFLPAGGYRRGTTVVQQGNFGHYWAASQQYFCFCNLGTRPSSLSIDRSFGLSIRPVYDESYGAVSTLNDNYVTLSAAHVNGNVAVLGFAPSCGFCYSATQPNPDIYNAEVVVCTPDDNGNIAAELPALPAGGPLYYYRAYLELSTKVLYGKVRTFSIH